MAAWANRRLTPHPLKTMTTAISLSGRWETVEKKIYVRLANYAAGLVVMKAGTATVTADEVIAAVHEDFTK